MGVFRKAYSALIRYPLATGLGAGAVYFAYSLLTKKYKTVADWVQQPTFTAGISLISYALAKVFKRMDKLDTLYRNKKDTGTVSSERKKQRPAETATTLEEMIHYNFHYYPVLRFSKSADKKIEISQKMLERFPNSKIARLNLVEFFCDAKQYDKALLMSKEIAEKSGKKKDVELGWDILRLMCKKKKTAEELLLLANLLIASGEGNFAEAIDCWTKISEFPQPEFKLLAADVLDWIPAEYFSSYRKAKSTELRHEAIETAVRRIKPENRLVESGRFVCVLGNEFLANTVVLKGNKNRDALQQEAANARVLEAILAEHENWYVPTKWCITERTTQVGDAQLYFYAMAREQGSTLLAKLEAGKEVLDNFKSAVGLLATVHSKARYSHKKSPIFRTMHLKKLREPSLSIPQRLQKKLFICSEPIFTALNPARRVQDCDASPDNFQAGSKERITLLDTERNLLVPQQIDLAKLLCYLKREQQDILIKSYIEKYTPEVPEPEFRLGYHNAVVHNAISLLSVWAAERRKSVAARRLELARAAASSIDRIKAEFIGHYDENKDKYIGLKEAVVELSEHLAQS